MKLRQRIPLLLAALLILFLTGCGGIAQLKNIQVTSVSLDSVTPAGLRAVGATLSVGVENPAMQFTLEDIEGVLYRKGKELVEYTADPVTVRRKSSEVYPVSLTARLAGDSSVLSLLGLSAHFDPEEFTTDVRATVRLKSGAKKKLDFKNIPIKELIP